MSFADAYLSKQQGKLHPIHDPPSHALRYAVIIPAFREENVVTVLDSLRRCARPQGSVEVIVVVNAPENADRDTREIHLRTLETVEKFSHSFYEDGFRFYALDAAELPHRHAGVGLARKIGMDEAVRRFNSLSQSGGLLISLDADCICDADYFTEIERYHESFPCANGFNLYFEHPVTGHEFPDRVYQGIIQYELHLRYYIQGLRYSGFPYAFHTVGSCYAVRASAYVKQGGMNRRKSGEDFYFLHKIIPLGDFHEINTTRVIPSSRPSLRVPFGTGPTLQQHLTDKTRVQLTYHPALFEILRDFFNLATRFYKQKPETISSLVQSLHPVLAKFLQSVDGPGKLKEINANCSSPASFMKRFYNRFDGFTVLKFLNFASAHGFPRTDIRDAACSLLTMKQITFPGDHDPGRLLTIYREMERRESWVSPLQR